jgi:predicted phage terminase large subunit-like protein
MTEQDILQLAREDLACYALAVYPNFELAAHHRLMVDNLEAVERGDISGSIICMPPRHGKSVLGTQIFPAWSLGRHPDRSIISASYGQELADDFGRTVRNMVSDPFHAAIFPEFRLAQDATSMRRFSTTAGGSYYAVGRGGAITGRGADLLLIDDPLKDAEEARSELTRRALHEWFKSVAYTRLQPGGAVVLISTRWHEDDLAGHLLREDPNGWVVLSLPAIAEVDESFRRAGDALWPEKFPLELLEIKRTVLGGAAFASLYQQRPAAAEGAVFKRQWWRYYSEQPVFRRVVQSWDTAFKTGSENDFSACTTWGVADNGCCLLWFWRDRVEFPELKKRMNCLAEEWRPHQILVEDKASGQSLIQELRYASALPIIPIKVDKDKLARAEAITPLIEAGRVFLPESVPWLNDYVDELAAFPNGVHDDAVDSTTQALNYLRHQPVHSTAIFNALTGECLSGY